MMTKKILLASLFIAFSFSVNAQSWWGNNKKVKGNGTIIIEKRTTSNYDAITVGGSFDVVLIKGTEGNITLKGEENIIPLIETEISGGTLKIKYKKNTNVKTTRRMVVTVTVSEIESIALGGSGNIISKTELISDDFSVSLGGSGNIELGINADETNVNIGGSGNIDLKGITNNLKCAIAGSGSIRAYNLTTSEINATIAGSGSVKATVKNKIKANLIGSGSIYYKGNPKQIDSKSIGSGSIIEKN
ncbi:head GIN domain-containing protein [Polaribacter sp.]|uniref:head GIN domain-containing protein n=1 Tax=Polaribacter sp. TaxID=1920175 RepID=UPI003F69CFEE